MKITIETQNKTSILQLKMHLIKAEFEKEGVTKFPEVYSLISKDDCNTRNQYSNAWSVRSVTDDILYGYSKALELKKKLN
jgi:hypothetical protein